MGPGLVLHVRSLEFKIKRLLDRYTSSDNGCRIKGPSKAPRYHSSVMFEQFPSILPQFDASLSGSCKPDQSPFFFSYTQGNLIKSILNQIIFNIFRFI